MTKSKQCLRCKALWIGISVGIIALIFIGFAVFDQSFYYDNYYYFADGIRFTLLFGGIALIGFLTGICFKEYCTGSADWDMLAWSIAGSIGVIFLLMLAIYFIPMAQDEWTVRGLGDDKDKILEFLETDLNCNTFDWHKDRRNWSINLEFENIQYSSDRIDEKYLECRS